MVVVNPYLRIVAALAMLLLTISGASAKTIGIPRLGEIGDQTVLCNEDFPPIDLKSIASDPDHNVSELTFTAYNNLFFNVEIKDGVAYVKHPHRYSRTDYITFRVRDPDGYTDTTQAAFTVTGCYEEKEEEEEVLPPVEVPSIPPTYVEAPNPRVRRVLFIPFTPRFLLERRVLPYAPGPETCAISTGHGLLQDLDCDKVPDIYDNCPNYNPDQADQDRDGLGDACDAYIAEAELQPSSVACGQAVLATATIVNNKQVPFKGRVKLFVKGLNIEASQNLELRPGSAFKAELTLRTPFQAEPGPYQAALVLEEGFNTGARSVALLNLDVYSCKGKERNSFVHVIEMQDVRPGGVATFPIKIVNNDSRAKSYSIVVKGLEEVATYSLDPGSVVIVPGKGEETVYLTVQAYKVKEGSKSFILEVSSGKDKEQEVLVLDVKEEERSDRATLGLAILALALLATLLLLAFKKHFFKEMFKNSKGEKALLREVTLPEFPEPSNKGRPWRNKEKVARLGLAKEKGWLYYVDREGDVSRSRMSWALKQQENKDY